MVAEILQRITEGDPSAFSQLVDMYQRPLFGFLGRLGCSQYEAQEIAQETFLKAWVHLHCYQSERAQFVTWLFTIARNLAYNAFEKSCHLAPSDVADAAETAVEHVNPENLLEQTQQKQRLQSALRQLPMSDRSALALFYVHELGLVDVARIENVTLATIKTRLHRAKEKLRHILDASKS
jgi:RNA polymerase sigma-70 factor, ECF subfamily